MIRAANVTLSPVAWYGARSTEAVPSWTLDEVGNDRMLRPAQVAEAKRFCRALESRGAETWTMVFWNLCGPDGLVFVPAVKSMAAKANHVDTAITDGDLFRGGAKAALEGLPADAKAVPSYFVEIDLRGTIPAFRTYSVTR